MLGIALGYCMSFSLIFYVVQDQNPEENWRKRMVKSNVIVKTTDRVTSMPTKTPTKSVMIRTDVYEEYPNSYLQGKVKVFKNWAIPSKDSTHDTITLILQLSVNRLSRLSQLIKEWNGPISAAIVVSNDDEMAIVEKWYVEQKHVRIHLVYCTYKKYPANMLRNIAMDFAKESAYYMIVDVDVHLSGSMSQLQQELQEDVVYVIPSFEFSTSTFSTYPASKSELQTLYNQKSIRPMHQGRRSYSGPLKHDIWFSKTTSYTIPYEAMFEPYFVRKWQKKIRWDQRFMGRGFNKQSHHFELWASGSDYKVVSNFWIIDLPHEQSSWNQPNSDIHENQHLWVTFREEVAMKYGLQCRASYWKQCDNSNAHCEHVCQRSENAPVEEEQVVVGRDRIFWDKFTEKLKMRQQDEMDGTRKLKTQIQACHDIDIVYTWVDGSNKKHMQDQAKYIPESAFDEKLDLGEGRRVKQSNLSFRFRDFGPNASIFKYSLRSVLKHAAWVRTIWIVTADESQFPIWMKAHPKVRFVHHVSIFKNPEKDLPTFNSCAIESNIHRIPGLANCYIYMNDDYIISAPITPETFWNAQQPLPYALFNGERAPRLAKDAWQKKISNLGRFLRLYLGVSAEDIFAVGHHGMFFVKSIMEECEIALQPEFKRTASEKWRTDESVWPSFVYSNYYVYAYSALPKRMNTYYIRLTDDQGLNVANRGLQEVLENPNKWSFLCINDLMLEPPSFELQNTLHMYLDQLFPDIAPWER